MLFKLVAYPGRVHFALELRNTAATDTQYTNDAVNVEHHDDARHKDQKAKPVFVDQHDCSKHGKNDGAFTDEQQKKEAEAFHKAEEIKATKELAAKLDGKSVTVKIKVGENGKVFGSVTAANVSDALTELGFDIEKKKIKMDAIKNVGTYNAEVRLMENISAKITVVVEGL